MASSLRRKERIILLLGLLSYVWVFSFLLMLFFYLDWLVGITFLLQFAGFVLAIAASVMAKNRLDLIKSGLVDPAAKKLIRAGLILGISGMLTCPLGTWWMLSLYDNPDVETHEDCLRSDLVEIAGEAYKYRTRFRSTTSDPKNYTGFTIPQALAENENARYTSIVAHPDTIVLIASSKIRDRSTISIKVGPDGKFIRWEYTGLFE